VSLDLSSVQGNQVSQLEAQHTEQWPVAGLHLRVPCVFSEEEKNDYKISMLEVQSRLVYRPVILYFLHKVNF
jgi:hypothetical protein